MNRAPTPLPYRILTVRAASNAMISSESRDCGIMRVFAHLARNGASVGEKAVVVSNAKK